MFKIAKLENVKNEVVNIYYATQEQNKYENGKTTKQIAKSSFAFLMFSKNI